MVSMFERDLGCESKRIRWNQDEEINDYMGDKNKNKEMTFPAKFNK